MSIIRFFTHHKCATKWLGSVLEQYAQSKCINYYHTHYSDKFLEVDQGIQLYTNADYRMIPPNMRSGVHIIRNPLDLLVSSYFSHLGSHSLEGWPELAEHRKILRACGKDLGISADWIFAERSDFYTGATAPLTSMRLWDYNDTNIINVRMEDIVENPLDILTDLFVRFVDVPDVNALEKAVTENSFSALANGRVRGQERTDSHYRKGLPNDWQNHLDKGQAALMCLIYKKILDRFYPECVAQ